MSPTHILDSMTSDLTVVTTPLDELRRLVRAGFWIDEIDSTDRHVVLTLSKGRGRWTLALSALDAWTLAADPGLGELLAAR